MKTINRLAPFTQLEYNQRDSVYRLLVVRPLTWGPRASQRTTGSAPLLVVETPRSWVGRKPLAESQRVRQRTAEVWWLPTDNSAEPGAGGGQPWPRPRLACGPASCAVERQRTAPPCLQLPLDNVTLYG